MTEVYVVSDFNADLVGRFLSSDAAAPQVAVESAPYGQLFPSLANAFPGSEHKAAFVWARPEGVAPEHRRLVGDPERAEQALLGLDTFLNAVEQAASRFRVVLVASFASAQAGRGDGLLNWTPGGESHLLAQMNLRTAERLAKIGNAYLLDSQRWLDAARPARDARYWYTMKFPFTEAVAQAAARDVKAALRAIDGQSRKLLVLDLDNTLWGGVIGEDGWQGLKLGGHDTVGEAYVDFQRALKALAERGVAIGVVSKNDEAVALEGIDRHPEMVLRRRDLAGWRINWNDKAQNIVDLTRELNLGLQSVIFIDDSPIERGRVSEALPEVLVPAWPTDPSRYADALRQLDCFDQPTLTHEDRERTQSYVQDRERSRGQAVATSLEAWLTSLDVKVRLEPVGPGNLQRVVQLANKTNQMNLRTRRMTETEFVAWLDGEPGRTATAVSVADRFGDVGLTGLITWECAGEDLEIVDYVLSCRAMGRQVEALMAHLAGEAARRAGRRSVVARLARTARNQPCLDFWRASGFTEAEPDLFVWDALNPYPKPEFITVETQAAMEDAT